jgi:exodeoxyribonuclease VII large subunit
MENRSLFDQEVGQEIVFSVSEYIEFLNLKIKPFEVKIIGEVGQVQFGPTGHVYFSLKDEKGGSMINCIIWKSSYRTYGIELKEGMKITAVGRSEIYAPSGRLSFVARAISLAGEGALKKEYERIKALLEKEGIFAEEKKRPLPRYPHKIGVITSRQGAVLADFLNNLAKFGFSVKMIDSRVEGQDAVEDLLASVRSFRKKDIEVLVVMRGGGSMESMMAFNNELLVREIASFPCPVIAGIGHHKDVSLVAMAADAMVSTPTAAANLLGDSWQKAALLLERSQRQIISGYEKTLNSSNMLLQKSLSKIGELRNRIIGQYEEMENKLRLFFQKIDHGLAAARIDVKNNFGRSCGSFASMLKSAAQQLEYAQKTTILNDPERQLKLGYSIAVYKGKILRSVAAVEAGQELDLRLADGVIISEIKKVKKDI